MAVTGERVGGLPWGGEHDDLLSVAFETAEVAGALLIDRRSSLRQRPLVVTAKSSATDAVTEMDLAAEELIVDRLLAATPKAGVIAEESGARRGEPGEPVWVVDPLDGTVNYLYGLPHFAVSIGARVGGETVVGVVAVPALDEVFVAQRGRGAVLLAGGGQAHTLRITPPASLATALLATGFAYDAKRRAAHGRTIAAVLPQVRDIRRLGAAAIDLCHVACGRVDLFAERGLAPWDVEAGALVVSEAGGEVLLDAFDDASSDRAALIAAGHAQALPALLRGLLDAEPTVP